VITQALNRVGLRILFLFGNLFRQDMHQPEYSDANKSARSRAQQFGLTKAWIQEKLGVLLHYYGINGEIDHKHSPAASKQHIRSIAL